MSFLDAISAIVDTGRISLVTVVEAAVGLEPPPSTYDYRLVWWSQKIFRDAEVMLHVRGRAFAEDESKPFILMSNHQSLYDIPALYCSVPGRIRMVAKKELFRVPVWGKAMRVAGFIRIDRGDRQQAISSLHDAAEQLTGGTRVWLAPEGTRSKDGTLGPFKSGGFRMALETGIPVLPIAIDGTRHILAAHTYAVHKGQSVTVTICPPIDPKTYGEPRRKEFMRDVRNAIARALGQPELPAEGEGGPA